MSEEVDIILAAYNGEEFIGEQIESILEQTHQNFFLIIGDDASRDTTPDVIHGYAAKNRGKLFFHQYNDNVGTILNFSRLADFSSQPYIMLSDQDDLWHPSKVEVTLSKMREMEGCYGADTPLLVHTDLSVVDEKMRLIHPSFREYGQYSPRYTTLPRVLSQNHVIGCTVMMNRPLLDLAFPIPEEAYMHDHWINLVATVFGKVGSVDSSTMNYRQHNQNWIGACKRVGIREISALFSDQHEVDVAERLLYAKIVQAYVFYRRYLNRLDEESKETIEKFITLKNLSFFEEVKRRLSCDFQRGGFNRALYDLLASYLRGPLPTKYQLKIQ